MSRLSVILICVAASLPLVSCAQDNGQVDPEIGRELSQRFKSQQQQFQTLSARFSIFSMQRPNNETYDYRILSGNIGECRLLVDKIRNEIFTLNYETATRDQARLGELIRATKIILDEDASIPGPALKTESVLDGNYAPQPSIPDLRGPALRAAIASELSFAFRVLAKARVPAPFAGAGPTPQLNATPCSDARDQFVARELETEKRLGYSDSGDFGEPNSYFSMAHSELGLLHYSAVHEMAAKAYGEGQKILSICSTQYGNANPASIVVLPNGPNGAAADAKAPKRANVSAGVAVGLLIQKTPPVYPPIAEASRVSGTVVLHATISATGVVAELRVVSGPAMLQQAALDAVRSWRYRPYLLNGEPVEFETTVNVVFHPRS